jgi:hypothetical protein
MGKMVSDDTTRLLRAILLVLLDARHEPEHATKPEILLHRAGLGNKEIGALLDKKEQAVQKAIVRAK